MSTATRAGARGSPAPYVLADERVGLAGAGERHQDGRGVSGTGLDAEVARHVVGDRGAGFAEHALAPADGDDHRRVGVCGQMNQDTSSMTLYGATDPQSA
jgi:hypothetical protein